jgi:type I restriction enzyme S subunit
LNHVPFLSVCDIQGGTQPPKAEWIAEPRDGYVRMLQIRDFTQPDKPRIEFVKDRPSLKKCNATDIMIARYGASLGKILDGLEGAYNVAMAKCTWDHESLNRNYLLYWLRSHHFQHAINNVGGRAAQAGFNKADLSALNIPLPPLAEQKRIAGILDAADALRAKRRESLAQLDTLLQSTFLDLFGDPVTNPKGWEVSTLNNVLTIEHGFAFKSEFFSDHGEYVVLTPGSFFEGGGYRDQGKKTKFYSIAPPVKYVLPAGALLVAMTEQAPGLLGSPIFVPEDDKFLHNQRLGRLHLSQKLLPQFVYHFFNTAWVRGEIQRTSTGTKVKHTSPSKIGSVLSIIPPLDIQHRFTSIVESIEQQKSRLHAELAELDNLFASLQSRAFNGEL